MVRLAFPRDVQNTENLAFAKVVKHMGEYQVIVASFQLLKALAGFRTNAATTDFVAILPEQLETTIKAAAEIYLGMEISDDLAHIHALCDQVISISEYRAQLSEYLRNRMIAIAPNLIVVVGELVGARLISHTGLY
jgi:nucleolar protein 58